ncbi:MAG TPA: hypothetical protein VMF30_09105, partial [Pirellulales bacterium]|nr:hypothetical protein [Pirellulales bacterium]
HNHNDVLSRTEYPDARTALEQGIAQLAQRGMLGTTPKGGAAHRAQQLAAGDAQAARAAAAVPANLENKSRITPSEFQLLARALAAQADSTATQNRAAVQMQAEQAHQAYVQWRYQRYYGYYRSRTSQPVFLGPW